MERKIRCHICQVDDAITLWAEEPYRVVQCQRCGLIYQNPQPNEPELNKIYDGDYFTYNYLHYEKERTDYFHNIWSEIEKIVGSSGRLLDIGCGVGFFLKVASETGWKVQGIEPSQFASHYAKDTFGLDVTGGRLNEISFQKDFFDLVTFWDVIAHIPDSALYLKKIHIWLKKNGFLLIKTPNWEISSFKMASLAKSFFSTKTFLHVKYQLSYFNLLTLRKLLMASGYKIIWIEYVEEIIKKKQIPSSLKEAGKFIIKSVMKMINKEESFICVAKKFGNLKN